MSVKSTRQGGSRAAEHGGVVKERRLALGLNRPAFVAQMERHGQEITPDYLNKLERGTAPLARASLEVREAIRAVLGYSAQEWQDRTGLYVPPTAASAGGTSSRSGPPVAPVVPFRETPVLIPPELQEVIDRHGDAYPELRDPTIQRIIAAPRNFGGPDNGPQTAQDWFEYFLVSRRYIRP